MKFIQLFIKKPVFTSMLFTALFVLGFISLFNIPYDLLPDVTKPELTVHTNFPDASPSLVEEEITRRVEEAVYGIRGVEDVRSVSTENKSMVTIYFHWKSDLKNAHLHLRERLDEVSWEFPEKAERSVILATGPTSQPVMGIWVKGDRGLVEKIVARRLEQINGVAEARVLGMTEKEIKIKINPSLIEALGITPEEIINTLKSYNIERQSGMVKEGNYTFPLKFESGTKTADEVKRIPLKKGKYHLRDIAIIEEGFEDIKSRVFYNNEEGYFIQIFKEWETNSIRLSNSIQELLTDLNENYPELKFAIPFDDAEFIIQSIKNILFSLLIGGFLAFLALFLFTGNKKVPFILSISMPLSIIPAFFFFYLGGISINTMSLAGIALAVGMLIDSSIIVLESIIKEGDAVKGAKEMSLAVTTGILTTIAVFFPVLYLKGISGLMLKPLSFAVISTLIFSLFVAFSLLPLLSKGIKKGEDTRFYKSLKEAYEKILEIIYINKKSVYLFSLLFLIFGIGSFFILKKEAIPTVAKELIIKYELPFNTSIKETEKVGERLSQYFIKKGASVLLTIGETDPFGLAHSGEGILRIKGLNINPNLHELFKHYHNISYSQENYNPVLSVFSSLGKITLRANYNSDKEGKIILKGMEENLPEAIFPYKEHIKEIKITPNNRLLSQTGISSEELLNRVRMEAGGYDVLEVERGEEKLAIVMQSNKEKSELKNLKIKNYPLSFLSDIEEIYSGRGILRFNGKRCIEATIPYKGTLDLPTFPFKIEMGGELEEYRKAEKSTLVAFCIAVFLVFLILASFYESLRLPLLIMVAVPFAVAGFLVSLLLTATSLNFISLIGLVVLVGIVVNDSIVLVDRAEVLKAKGNIAPGKKAAQIRMKSIVMTTITTVFGLLPFSLGKTLYSPMGRGIIGGLILSTFITLVLIPLIYDRFFS
jgi:HAE1 family hydrophobic/amphiphilic exporter-1